MTLKSTPIPMGILGSSLSQKQPTTIKKHYKFNKKQSFEIL
jgi:hypothetical protein